MLSGVSKSDLLVLVGTSLALGAVNSVECILKEPDG